MGKTIQPNERHSNHEDTMTMDVEKYRTHHELMKAVENELNSRTDCRVFPNRTGATQRGGRYISFGLVKGGSDLIGWLTRGGVAVFLAIEIKVKKDTLKPAQKTFIDAVNNFGGIAGVCRSVEDARKLVGECLK